MWRLQLRRRRYARRVAGTMLEQCWQKRLPSTSSDWRQVSFLVVDAEMSSLEVADGELLSVGWVEVAAGAIALSTARHYLIKAEKSVGQSATIHHLRDCELNDADPREEVLSRFLQAAAGKVLVFHNAKLDIAFLDDVCRQEFNAPVLMPCVDTLLLEQALLQRRGAPIERGALRLQGCRDRYNLPPYPAHNALLDALATAELLVAHAMHRARGQSFTLGKLL